MEEEHQEVLVGQVAQELLILQGEGEEEELLHVKEMELLHVKEVVAVVELLHVEEAEQLHEEGEVVEVELLLE